MKPYYDHAGITIYHGDCRDILPELAQASMDMVLCDLPYGATACGWDVVIPFAPLWDEYRRTLTPNAAVVLTGSQPFTTSMIASNMKDFKYCWVWEKSIAANFGVLKWQPAKQHEDIAVFCAGTVRYYPQMSTGLPYTDKARSRGNQIYAKGLDTKAAISNTGTRHPSSIIRIPNPNNRNEHPTQKPLSLFAYMIRTYTKPGDVVLDNCCGSGTTGVAAKLTGRRAVQIDAVERYCEIAAKRLSQEVLSF